MSTWTRRTSLAIAGCVLLGVGLAVATLPHMSVSVAQACGGFFRSRTVAPEKKPSLAREKVLLIHDAKKREQHFIREVAFQKAREPFGFVVPTPTRPTVATVKNTPFTKLRTSFPFAPPRPALRGGGGAKGMDTGRASGGGVTVLEVKKVGSFTAFILAATDEQALAKWLADNQLVSSTETDAWLAHYVRMGFYYVAMRYDPPKKKPQVDLLAPPTVEAETVRISFATPLPYYPYLEPDSPKLLPLQPRLMELWYVGSEPVVPVAVHENEGKHRWVRPLRDGQLFEDKRELLESSLANELRSLLPQGALVVQTFQDQKFSRAGFKDVLFTTKREHALTPERVAQLEPLLGILDPELVSEAK